ncbi:hypothetical protein Pcinc_016425 [Petrolisthes cinctipes]|uniref:Uncharacterized protein n=1 Tax=Petrolisthes cinctipes TaxID=88211 RepID=A0AAE1FSH2_PETCI|nr:hypothetical protein Pcinc_016425 [Petrolisthes cinctipes]
MSGEKDEVLASHFSHKMSVPDPGRLPPIVPRLTNSTIKEVILGTDERTFVGRVSRMWNIFNTCIPNIREINTQGVKMAAHKWRGMQPTPLTLVT